jgi:prepilin-type N-terminal cleavage/methylation domain-containing protein
MSARSHRQRGFSLVEMAVALLIVGLLLGGLLGTVGALEKRQHSAGTAAQLEEVRDALTAYAVANRRLPCPANPATPDTVAGAGLENAPTAAGCTGGASGALPWATLGLPSSDAWGRRFTYRVSAVFARTAPAFDLASVGDNVIRNAAGVVLASAVPAVVVSHGENARGSRGPGGAAAPAGTDLREQENADGDADFVLDSPTDTYDDQVSWLPTPVLAYRMLQAGALP